MHGAIVTHIYDNSVKYRSINEFCAAFIIAIFRTISCYTQPSFGRNDCIWPTSIQTEINDITMPSQITSVSIVCSSVCTGADQRKRPSSASLAFVRGIHRWPGYSPHKGPVTRKMLPFDDVIMDARFASLSAHRHERQTQIDRCIVFGFTSRKAIYQTLDARSSTLSLNSQSRVATRVIIDTVSMRMRTFANNFIQNHSNHTLALWRLKSTAAPLFVQKLFRETKGPHSYPFVK